MYDLSIFMHDIQQFIYEVAQILMVLILMI